MDCLKTFDLDLLFEFSCSRDDLFAPAGIAGVQTVLSFFREVELPFKGFGAVGVDFLVQDQGVLVGL